MVAQGDIPSASFGSSQKRASVAPSEQPAKAVKTPNAPDLKPIFTEKDGKVAGVAHVSYISWLGKPWQSWMENMGASGVEHGSMNNFLQMMTDQNQKTMDQMERMFSKTSQMFDNKTDTLMQNIEDRFTHFEQGLKSELELVSKKKTPLRRTLAANSRRWRTILP